jgi:hypothetical protein
MHNTSQKCIMYKLYNTQNTQNMAKKSAEYAYFADLGYYSLQNIQKEYCDLHLLNSESRHVLFPLVRTNPHCIWYQDLFQAIFRDIVPQNSNMAIGYSVPAISSELRNLFSYGVVLPNMSRYINDTVCENAI